MSSLTDKVFPCPDEGYYWIYYTITKSQEATKILGPAKCPHPVVLMFSASWNQPSQLMLDSFGDLALAKCDEAVFCEVDVDKCKDLAKRYRVEALPTFLLIKQGTEKARVVGAKVGELDTKIKDNI